MPDEVARQTPVVLIVFNRPECTERVLGAIRENRPDRLWVIADGARNDRAGERERVVAVRALVESGIDWSCEVRRVYSDVNLGCARRVASGLDAVFSEEDEAIILEDDCLPDPTFFRYCAELLARYRDEPRVGHISGSRFVPRREDGAYYFSRYPHVWGWATWGRAWRCHDRTLAGLRTSETDKWLRELLGDRGAASYWRDNFGAVASGRINTWDYQWVHTMWRQQWLAITPGVNLVQNIGFDGAGAHSVPAERGLSRAPEPLCFPITHPVQIARDVEADAWTERHLYSGGVWRRARRVLRRWLRASPQSEQRAKRSER